MRIKGETFLKYFVAMVPSLPKAWLLRVLLYRKMLARMGKSVYIQHGVEIIGGRNIEIGDNVAILKNSIIKAQDNSQICIGDYVQLKPEVEIEAVENAKIKIGARTVINKHVWIHSGSSVEIGQDCLIAPYVGILATNWNYADCSKPINTQGSSSKGIVIGDDCWLGHRVSVVDGVKIGQGSVIGAGAVVTKDIPPYSIAVGVPAKVVASRKSAE